VNRPSVRQLECVVAIADHGSFRAAARACSITQPALSAQIASLEAELGAALFERVRPRARPTPLGVEVVARARELLAGLDAIGEVARGHGEPLSSPLRLGVIPTIAPYLLPRAMPRLRRKHPGLRLFLREAQTPELVAAVTCGELDCALLAAEAELGDLETAPLFEEPFLLAVPRGHPLAEGPPLRERDLQGSEVLLLEDGHCLRDQALSVCRRARAPEVADVRAGSLATLIEMVAGGLGITLLPEMATAGARPLPRDLVLRPFAAPAPTRTIALAWRRRASRTRDFQLLAEFFRREPGWARPGGRPGKGRGAAAGTRRARKRPRSRREPCAGSSIRATLDERRRGAGSTLVRRRPSFRLHALRQLLRRGRGGTRRGRRDPHPGPPPRARR